MYPLSLTIAQIAEKLLICGLTVFKFCSLFHVLIWKSSFLPFNFKLHTTLDPYNTTEEVELTLCDANFDWTNAQIKCLAELNLFVRTASKYDDCQLLHLPNLTLTIQVNGFEFGAVIIDRPLTYDFWTYK